VEMGLVRAVGLEGVAVEVAAHCERVGWVG
jgi:hypothetical protein